MDQERKNQLKLHWMKIRGLNNSMDRVYGNNYIGDIHDARRNADEFDLVFNVSNHELDVSHEEWHPLLDGYNKQERFDRTVDALINALKDHDRVLVNCAVGKSRSVTVLATAMAYQEDKTFTEALTKVCEARPIANPVQGLRDNAVNYLE